MSEFERVGYIGVDAGVVMFVDPCYIVPDEDWGRFCDELLVEEIDDVTKMRGGIVVGTAWGDGSYPVEVRRLPNGRVAEVRVIFDSDEDWENDEEELEYLEERETDGW